jgi:peroxidase
MARMMAVLVVAAVAAVGGARAQLQDGFYAHSCPRAEQIVKGFVEEHVPHVPSVAATLLRTHFHDCFVRVIKFSFPPPSFVVVQCQP